MGATRISCSEYSFPAVPGQRERIGLVALLGFELVDVALFLPDGGDLLADRAGVTARLRAALDEHGLASEDLFLAVGETVEEIAPNQREPSHREQRRREFSTAVRIASELGIRGITVLPGVSWAEDPAASWAVCVEELSWRVEEAAALGVEVRIEPHAGSIAPLPELTTRLCDDVPGLRLTLDLSHFELQSVTLDRMLTLVPLTGHLHVRAAKPGAIQVRWRDNETDFAALVASLRSAGYDGAYCVEYVPMPKWRCDELDVVTEALATRDALVALGVAQVERLCHGFRVAPGREEEYVRRHVEIWPEMVEAMKAAGFANYTLFRRGTDVIAVCECHPDVETCFARFAEHGVGERWQESMAGLVVGLVDEDGELVRYAEDWHLD